MKTISILLALVNSLAAGLVIAASLPAIQILRPASSVGNATRVAISIGIIGAGILSWVAAGRDTNQGLLLLTGLYLVAVGTAAAVWTVHLALASGRIQDEMFLYGGSLILQGASSIWDLLLPGRDSSIA
ncbi:MAG: hypothetical protein ACXWNQ_10005 [Anaerolineales bacterium]